MRGQHDERLLRLARLEPDEEPVASCRAWVSRAGPLDRLVAARTRDLVLVTDRRLLLFATGFFTRRPRRRVLADRLDELTVSDTGKAPGRRIEFERETHRPLVLDLGQGEDSRGVAAALLARTATIRSPEAADESTEPR